jgi:protein TonB
MIRNGRALFISFVIHGAIAAAAIMALQAFQKEKPGEEARMCIALAQFARPVAKAPEPKPLPEKVQPRPPKQESKPAPKPKPKPPKKVEKPKIEKPIIKEKAPVAIQEEVIEETVPEPPAVPEEAPEEEVQEEEVTAVAAAEAPAPVPVPQLSAGERYMQEHIALITKLLRENLYYPRMARKRGITGEVMVAFELQSNGKATGINVMSGERGVLNRAAVKTIERLSGRFPRPSEPITLHVPIRYELR